ncbi:MAG: zinc ribbon domain-containing protein [Chloroflexota bacterium]
MEPRIFHGKLTPEDLARTLVAAFNRGNLRAAQYGQGRTVAVQIATRDRPMSGGQTALTVQIQRVEDGVSIQMGEQGMWGVAASLGQTALSTLLNPWNLLGRLDDLAQDVENLQLSEKVWKTIEAAARAAGASHELSERLRRMVCAYCNTANPVGEPACIACGAPLGKVQPNTCKKCGFVFKPGENFCANCGATLP